MVRQIEEREFREWAQARRTALRRTAFLLCGDWHLADDLTQTTLTKMYAAWPRIRALDGPDAYVKRVLVNAYLDSRRRPWRREHSTEVLPESALRDRTDDVLDRQVVLEAMSQLPLRQRAVMVLRYWEDMNIEQTAAALGCSTGTIKSQTAKAQQHLRRLLGPLSDETHPATVTVQEPR